MLSISERTVRNWLKRIDKDAKEARNKRIFDMWLACHTQQEIADAEGIRWPAVDNIEEDLLPLAILPKVAKLTPITPPTSPRLFTTYGSNRRRRRAESFR